MKESSGNSICTADKVIERHIFYLFIYANKMVDIYNQSSILKGETVTQPTTLVFEGLLTIISQPAVPGIPLIPSSAKCGSTKLLQTQ